MAKGELPAILEEFAPGNGFGNPDERRNAELRLQAALAEQQRKTADRLNLLTLLLVVVGCLQVVILAFQVRGK
jgi:hypothetical protein